MSTEKKKLEMTGTANQKLKGFAVDVLKQIRESKSPKVSLPIRALSNIYFDEKNGIIQLGNKIS
ncbi:MAG: hypothetical protein ABIH90_00635, partial [Candidatus Aenigmatarchaeota archaeon]